MKKFSCSPTLIRLAAAVAVALSLRTVTAQNLVFYQDFDTNSTAIWTVNAGLGANLTDFFFDYSLSGVPSAPHSTGGTTRGMILQPNMDPLTQAGSVSGYGLSVNPSGFGITENFEMHFDLWLNYPKSGSGSTVIGGAGFGTAGTAAQIASASSGVVDSVFIGASTDGGTVADYRIYTPVAFTSITDGNPAYVNVVNRNNTQLYYTTNFPAQSVPQAQTNLFPAQTGLITPDGVQGMKWHDVALKKIANIIDYRIDGILIARIDFSTNGTLGGTNIVFNCFDINGNASTDPLSTNLIFALFDNVRITNFANVVTVYNTTFNTNATATITEGNASPGTFTITRTASGTPLTVAYSMSGTAANGVDYTNAAGTALSGTVTFAPTATATNIQVFTVDDTISETTETIVISVDPSPNYIGAGNSTIQIIDNEPSAVAITNVSAQMYERTNDFATFRITRLGSTNVSSFTVNLSFSGTATYGTDFYTNAAVTFDPGVQATNFNVYPIVDGTYEGNETVTVNVAAGASYTIASPSSASITLVDADGPAETVLFSDNFNTDSSANWNFFFGATNVLDQDYAAIFAFDYSGQNLPPAPHGSGDTLGLFVTVNKDATLTGTATAAALNLYPIGQNFSGNYALRFDMWMNMLPGLSVTTEYTLCGINHSGTKTNWWRSGGVPAGWTFDGIFYAIESDAQATPGYVNYSSPTTVGNNPTALSAGVNASSLASVFKAPPWTVAGTPGVTSTNAALWSEVELSQIGNIITLRINNSTIFSYNNTNSYKSGNIMIGYEDAFDSLGNIQSYCVFDNVRVVRLQGLKITGTTGLGANVQIDFTFDLSDSPASFLVQSASVVSGPYADAAATIIQLSPGVYRATVAKIGAAQFYRIRHQ